MYYFSCIIFTSLIASFYCEVPPEVQDDWIQGTTRSFSVCVCETGVDEQLAWRLFRYLEYPDDSCLACYLNCIHRRHQLMYPDGSWNWSSGSTWLMVSHKRLHMIVVIKPWTFWTNV
ncbi:uncharacterized protein LOC116182655 [Photinus pyralis]|uniref:uncharacterized protein LOC116182655 n=1 Tax=Photinus pyralis TaxID=7054 RepID=UPI0012672227|nr:uncharacterized protein LOC116182655 [Photinus pyralis]